MRTFAKKKVPFKIAILASGAGSNALNIIQHFQHNANIVVDYIASNKAGAGVLNIAAEHHIDHAVISKSDFLESDAFIQTLNERGIDMIVLAGFLWKVPEHLVRAFHDRIINIHPALLPKFGGKGMYGHFVHEAVFAQKEKESGITIHYVNEHYDEGQTIFQARVALDENDTPQTIEQKVRRLEIEHFPAVIEALIAPTLA